jgi:hypothetical protein
LPGDSTLAAGISIRSSLPLDPRGAIAQCAFLRDALTSQGNNYTNPLWNLTTLIATFCDNGRLLAHNMGRKHPEYSKETTDELFDRKVREKDEKGLGWPACATISGSGCRACQSCPHFSKGQSPLHLATPAAPAAAAPFIPASTPLTTNKDLPPGYARRGDGVVCKLLEGEGGETIHAPLCNYPMYDPWVQADPFELHFTTTMTGTPKQISIPTEIINTQAMRPALQGQFLMLHAGAEKHVGEFFVSWLEKLKNSKDSVVSTTPFGWNVKNGAIDGFVYNNVWTPTGTRKAPVNDRNLARQYEPTGDPAHWVAAANMVTSQGRPELDAIIASSFGAPLIRFTNQTGVLLSVYSEESGIGKTTAMKVAQAVWGDPVRAMQGLSDTANSVLNKLGVIRSLPLYWDELKTEDDTQRFVNNVFQLSTGKEKSRMTSKITHREVGTWQTMLVSASNESLLDYVTSRTKMTTAGLFRVFEYVVQPNRGQGQIEPDDAQRMVGKLNDNYGQIGLEYARFLGINHVRIDAEVSAFTKTLYAQIKTSPDERFWAAVVVSICMGAKYSNELGFTKIDEAALRMFMISAFTDMRTERHSQPVDMKNAMNVSNVFSQFMGDMRSRNTLHTNIIHNKPGRPTPGSIRVVGDASRLDRLVVHVGHDDKRLRVTSAGLEKWLEKEGYSRHQFVKALVTQFNMTKSKGRIGSGTTYVGGTEYLLELDLAGSPLANFIDEA